MQRRYSLYFITRSFPFSRFGPVRLLLVHSLALVEYGATHFLSPLLAYFRPLLTLTRHLWQQLLVVTVPRPPFRLLPL